MHEVGIHGSWAMHYRIGKCIVVMGDVLFQYGCKDFFPFPFE